MCHKLILFKNKPNHESHQAVFSYKANTLVQDTMANL